MKDFDVHSLNIWDTADRQLPDNLKISHGKLCTKSGESVKSYIEKSMLGKSTLETTENEIDVILIERKTVACLIQRELDRAIEAYKIATSNFNSAA